MLELTIAKFFPGKFRGLWKPKVIKKVFYKKEGLPEGEIQRFRREIATDPVQPQGALLRGSTAVCEQSLRKTKGSARALLY